ncbi:MAG TPA: hypothetical protein VFR19_07760 [Hyphomicrobiaceae bacterium]|jgi:hypothetical protein|nr:hypothetical protein [Hyphomicrobiaceae bacterium]
MSDSARAIAVQALTHCDVCCSGQHVEIGFTDHAGKPGVIYLPHESLSALLATLTAAVEEASERRTGAAGVQLVHPLVDWGLDRNGDDQSIVLTLRAPDGFDVSFRAAAPLASALSEALKSSPQTVSASAKPAAFARLRH